MKKLMTGLFVLVCALGVARVLLAAGQPAGMFSDETTTESYDCRFTVQRTGAIPAGSAVTLLLEWESARRHTRVVITPERIVVCAVRDGKETECGRVDSPFPPGVATPFTILRRGDWLGIMRGDALIFRGKAPRASGARAGITTGKSWTVEPPRIQRIAPVAFADNFMRTKDEPGDWTVQSGTWGLQSAWDANPRGREAKFTHVEFAANPFAWRGSSRGPALCTAGKPHWEDYTLSVAVRPLDGSAGVLVNAPDARNGYLVRWSAANDTSADGNALSLLKLTNGKTTSVARDAGGYIPGQWYRLAVTSDLDGIHVAIDGHERLAIPKATPWRGGIGLYLDNGSAIFDDVTVYGRTLRHDLLAEQQLARITRRFQDDEGMVKWANARSDWRPMPAMPGAFVHRLPFYGDQWATMTITPPNGKDGRCWLALNGDGASDASGYRAEVTQRELPPGVRYRVYNNTTLLAQADGKALHPGEEYTIRFAHLDNRLRLEVDGDTVLDAADGGTRDGVCPAYGGEGSLASPVGVLVLGRQYQDDVFADAPTSWLGRGTWAPTVRWSCSPEWSFLGGWSRGEAALWHKQRFTGDHVFSAFMGFLMEYPREHISYHQRYRDVAITICGDGEDPRSGYAAIYGASDENGNSDRRSLLLRNGVIVGTSPRFIPPYNERTHRDWYGLQLEKRGNRITFSIDGEPVITFTDPDPIDGGVPAVWTSDNGIALARTRLSYAQPAQPRTTPQVMLDTPWWPEWANVGRPLMLDFTHSWSTSGHDVRLQVTPQDTPVAENTAPVVDGKHIIFTPSQRGSYWYRIIADDGAHRSPDFHLHLPAFDPALGRDDSHAVLLYRFNEGAGTVVKDQSGVAPALNLAVPDGAAWVPEQGISVVDARGPIQSTEAATKLQRAMAKNSCTFELWVSTQTLYPFNNRGSLLSWETADGRWNYAIGQSLDSLMAVPQDVEFLCYANAWATVSKQLRTGLQHLVVTWDGKNTTGYVNGVRQYTRRMYFASARWQPDALLLLGQHRFGADRYLGTYYLAAIHDTCLTDEQVRRHYQAGPSAR